MGGVLLIKLVLSPTNQDQKTPVPRDIDKRGGKGGINQLTRLKGGGDPRVAYRGQARAQDDGSKMVVEE